MIVTPILDRELTFNAFHLCAGIGGGARGFQDGHARLGRTTARFRTIGAVDVDRAACAAFDRITGARSTVLDLFSREQYEAFHGRKSPPDWREATADDLRRAAGWLRPNVVFSSSPCKGLSALLSPMLAVTAKYQALNQLTIRSFTLALEAWGDDPPELMLLENVPRIQQRGRALLDDIKHLLEMAGYVVAETVHDCGELGGLAQHRQRFLLVARHKKKVPPFLYEPGKRPVRGIGEVLATLPLPDMGPHARGLHRLPRLEWQTWVRLALIEAGSDWRSLEKLKIEGGYVQGIGIVPWHGGVLGVTPWDEPSCTITGEARPSNGSYSVADPRPGFTAEYQQFGVVPWDKPANTVTGQNAPGGGAYSVADPRSETSWGGAGKFRVTGWEEPGGTLICDPSSGNGITAIADPRREGDNIPFGNIYRVICWDEVGIAVTSSRDVAVADPRLPCTKKDGEPFANGRHFGILPWGAPSPAITARGQYDNGASSVADPRGLPAAHDHPDPTPWIIALDGTRHRPLTALEGAALQGYAVQDPAFWLDGSDSKNREHIGNSVPPPAAAAIASTMLGCLLAMEARQTFTLSSAPIWVDRATAIGLSMPNEPIRLEVL